MGSWVIMLISWFGCWLQECVYCWKFIQWNTCDLCIFLYLCYCLQFFFFLEKAYEKRLYIHLCSRCRTLWQVAVLFQGKVSATLILGMSPLIVQVVEKCPQKFLRKLFIIFISEGCADFSFKEISNLFQTGNCWGNEIRLLRMLVQLDSSGVVPWSAGQFACSALVLILWELPPFPSPPG